MGLDMYLNAYQGADENTMKKIVAEMKAESFIRERLPYVQVSISVAYWRKAQEVHNWFVRHCANGVDDCKPMYVTRKKLEELLKVSKEVQSSKNPDALGGFTNASAEALGWYYDQITVTITQLEKALANVPDDWDFEYQASW